MGIRVVNIYGSAQESVTALRFRRVWLSGRTTTAAAFGLGMWDPAFRAGFQAPRAGNNLRVQSSPHRPRRVISTPNARSLPIFLNFLNMQPLTPFLTRFVDFQKAA
jgi:hypothetical protein